MQDRIVEKCAGI